MTQIELNADTEIKKIGVVILNYINYSETINCIRSLIKQKKIHLKIVVVDNGSGNESFDRLTENFSDFDNISIIKSDINIGYARGNNLGIEYLLNKGLKDIFVANSDLLFCSEFSLSQIIDGYESGIGLINPIIKNLNGTIDQRVSYKKKMLYFRMLKKFIEWFTGKTISANKNVLDGGIEAIKRITGKQVDKYIIAGSGFLLTKDYFKTYKGLYPGTFLYYEEWATIILLNKAGLNTKVVESDPIIHKGGASTPNNVKMMSSERRKICMNSWKAIFKLAVTPKIITYKRY